MDYQALLYNPTQLLLGVPATLALGGDRHDVTVIDKTTGIDTGDEVHGQTILPACVIRAQEVLKLGYQLSALGLKNVNIEINSVWWHVVTYRLRPSPAGENFGEVYLLLSKAPIVAISTLTIPPPDFRDDDGIAAAALSVFWDFGLLGMDIDPDFLDDTVLDATMTVTTELVAALADDLGISKAQLLITIFLVAFFADDLGLIAITNDQLAADIVDDTGLSAVISVATFLAAALADDNGLAAALGATTLLSASFADDAGLSAVLSATSDLSANLADDTGLSATISVTASLAAAIADDTGLSATISALWQLSAAIVDDLGLAATVSVSGLTANIVDDLGLAAAVDSPPIVFGAVNGSPVSPTGVQTAKPAGITSGQLLISVVLCPNADTGGFSASAGWTIIQQVNSATYSKAIAYRIANNTNADQITWSWANGAVQCWSNFSRYTGGAKSIGNSSVNTGSGTAATPTAINAAKGGSFFLDVSGIASGAQPAAPSGWTGVFGGGSPNPQEEAVIKAVPQAGTSSGTPSTTVTSGQWCAILFEVSTLQ